jgi:hypothetical protein
MLRKKDLVEMASIYRAMADRALDPKLQFEFADRAARYETAAWAVQRVEDPPRSKND